MSSFIPLPTRSEVVNRLVKDKNRAHTEALKIVADRLNKAPSLPVYFIIEELGPDADVQRKVVEALEHAGWGCRPTTKDNKIVGYEVE